MGVLQYSVRQATRRLLELQCSRYDAWVPGVGQCPRLWRSKDGRESASGLQQMEAGQKRTYADMLAA